MVRLLMCAAALLISACASAPADQQSQNCAVLAAHITGSDTLRHLTQEQAEIALATAMRASLPAGGIQCGDAAYRTDFAYYELTYTGIAYTADNRYAVIRSAMWWGPGRGYNTICMVERDGRAWRAIGCAPGAMT